MDSVLSPLYTVVSWILIAFHSAFTAIGLPEGSGLTWTLTIMGLVIVIRILLIPLFVKQIKGQRALQMLQPEIKKLQEKYKHDREKQSQELMKLYRERKANPFSSCLPVLAQAPVFIALFGVLNGMGNNKLRGAITQPLADSAQQATIFGAQLFDTFLKADSLSVRVVSLTLVLCMTASTFFQQRQLLTKGMPASALTGQFAQQQKILMYVLPLVFGFTGLNFPIGVLLYWFTTNIWSLGQQQYVIQRMPAPGSPAEQAMQQRREERQRRKGLPVESASPVASAETEQPAAPRRQQPKKQSRGKRR